MDRISLLYLYNLHQLTEFSKLLFSLTVNSFQITTFLSISIFISLVMLQPLQFVYAQNEISVPSTLTTSKPSLRSPLMEPINDIKVGRQVVIATTITNHNQTNVKALTIVIINDSSGITQHIFFQSNVFGPEDERDMGFSWTPDSPGTYDLRVLSITGFDNPSLLSPISTATIVVR